MLPVLTASGTTLDGITQTAFTGNTNAAGPEVMLNGFHQLHDGLVIKGAGCVVRSLIVSGFTASGISLTGPAASSDRVEGCFLGLDASGATALPNFNGVLISAGAHNNVIGGTTALPRNVISGNQNDGIHIEDGGSNSNVIHGNFIGPSASGVTAVPNGQAGVGIIGSRSTLIGGPVSGARNVLSGNTNGVAIIAGASGTVVQGNYLGLDATGKKTLPSPKFANGVVIGGGASGNIVGGTVPRAANVMAGNDGSGVVISGRGSVNNVVLGNTIGILDATGHALGNSNDVAITDGAQHNVIGGTTVSARNYFGGNGFGVWLKGIGASNNQIEGNYIGTDSTGTKAFPNNNGVFISNGASRNGLSKHSSVN